MHHKNTEKDLIGAGVFAGLGAGVVTSFAINQGQNPLVAMGITAIAIVAGILFRLYDLS